MLELVRKAMLAGIGVAAVAKERVEKIADELVTRGEMAEGEKATFVREMTDKIMKEAEHLFGKVDDARHKAASRILSRDEEIRRRDEEIAQLKEQLQAAQEEQSEQETEAETDASEPIDGER